MALIGYSGRPSAGSQSLTQLKLSIHVFNCPPAPVREPRYMSKHDILVLPDGAQIAYEVWGAQHVAQALPIILVGGISTIRGDWDRLAHCLAATRPGIILRPK